MDDRIKCKTYRPLPDGLYIGMSSIEGNGLFTIEFIKKDTELGISHIKNDSGDFHSGYIRTPLGGFVNHDKDNPNCIAYECGQYLRMKTTQDIQAGKELTLNYLLHEPCKDYMTDECKDSTYKNLTYPEFVEEHYVGKHIK